jgi:hypothetical protein
MKKFVVAGLLLAGFATPALSEMRRTGRSRDTLARIVQRLCAAPRGLPQRLGRA